MKNKNNKKMIFNWKSKKWFFTCVWGSLIFLLARGAYAQPRSLPPELMEMMDSAEQNRNPNLNQNRGNVVQSKKFSSEDIVVNSETGEAIIDVLDLKNMDILDVLKLISKKSGVNIVAGQSVKGRITVYLKKTTVEEALEIIVEAYGWAFRKENGIIKVMSVAEYETRYGQKFGRNSQTKMKQLLFASPTDMAVILQQVKSASGKIVAEEKSGTLIMIDSPAKLKEMEMIIEQIDVPVQTEIFNLSYAKAEDLSSKILEMLTPSVGTMKQDKRSNRIVVSDTSQKIKKIAHLIDVFDQKDKEVNIEAKILQVVLSDEYKMGVDWQNIVSDLRNMSLVGDFDIIGATDKKGQLSIGTIAEDNYQFLIEALDTVGVTDILSSPSITTINNEEAKILVGSTEPYVTTTTTTPASGPTTTAEAVNFIEVGVKLYVTPIIHDDGFITMKIKPEVSTVTRNITTSNNNTIPVVETAEAETTVVVKDGITIVIGGLIKDEKINAIKKIPLFGDIPFLGAAFRNETDLVRKTEIVIFLTPHIIAGDVDFDQ